MSTPQAPANNPPVIITLGNPNTGKSTLFNALTGMRQTIGNFPGVTVEHLNGEMQIDGRTVAVVDLPGTYSLAAGSPDEMVAVDVLLGKMDDVGAPDAIIVVVDANNLRRNLFLASQILETSLPVVIALNMIDVALAQGAVIDAGVLAQKLGAPVIPICASRDEGLDDLRRSIADAISAEPGSRKVVDQALRDAAITLQGELRSANHELQILEVERALIDVDGYAESRLLEAKPEIASRLGELREQLGQGRSLSALEARARYGFINKVVTEVETRSAKNGSGTEWLDKALNHPLLGSAIFVFTMGLVFQSVFAWAAPLMDFIDARSGDIGAFINANVSSPLLASFFTDGVVAGVGSVLIFLPQIIILFAFIILLEDTGYMSRAAFLMDRLMRWCGLSGQSFIPMLSSFACAVPGIMGTRVIPNSRDRIATIISAPFMTCSARLPVYALLIAAFVPPIKYLDGWVNLQGLVLLGFYLLGMFAGVLTAWLLNRTLLRGPTPSFMLELPPYRIPNWRSVLIKLYGRAGIFLRRAGTIIFCIAIIIWFLASFPRAPLLEADATPLEQATASSLALEQSYLGSASKSVAPLFEPLGWDWKITAAVIASFPAREVVIAVLGTIYAIDTDDESSLIERIKRSKWPDGRPVYTLPMALGLMVFYALCLQCVATIAVMRRETNTWRWPLFAWVYMTSLGYFGALFCFKFGTALGIA